MKTSIFSLLLLLSLAPGAAADPDRAPFINNQLKALEKKVDSDLTAGNQTKADADELKREIAHVRSIQEKEPSLVPATRRDLREDVSKIQSDLERKERQGKALASASPSATP